MQATEIRGFLLPLHLQLTFMTARLCALMEKLIKYSQGEGLESLISVLLTAKTLAFNERVKRRKVEEEELKRKISIVTEIKGNKP